jgi:hypothetical protein
MPEVVIPDTRARGSAERFRDIAVDQGFLVGYRLRQFADGTIHVLNGPQMDNFGYWVRGTSGGPLHGATIDRTHPAWPLFTKEIGPHPAMGKLPGAKPYAGYAGAMTAPSGRGVPLLSRLFGQAKTAPRGVPYGAPFVSTLTDVLTGFGPEPAQSDAGQLTSAAVGALPGIQATVNQLLHPGTMTSLTKQLGRLKGQLATTRDPMQQSILREQIKGIEWQIASLQGQMAAPTGAPPTGATSLPIPPWVLLGGGVLLLGGLAYVASRSSA